MHYTTPIKAVTTMTVSHGETAEQRAERYREALQQIKLYHENMHGAKAKDFIAYDIACKALEES